jgi:DnaK suppressor protein
MDDQFEQIRHELKVTKKELVDRLSKADYDMEASLSNVFSSVSRIYEQEKSTILQQRMRAELEDVNRALLKMELGLYGMCENSGELIPFDKLKVIPTARTTQEASVTKMF